MVKYYTGKEICSEYEDLANDAFGTESHRFILTNISKEKLYNRPCSFSPNGRNLMTYPEWEKHPENYDGYHTDNVKQMIDYIKEGGTLPPLIANKDLGLYDGQHRLTAYSMSPSIKEIAVYQEV